MPRDGKTLSLDINDSKMKTVNNYVPLIGLVCAVISGVWGLYINGKLKDYVTKAEAKQDYADSALVKQSIDTLHREVGELKGLVNKNGELMLQVILSQGGSVGGFAQ